MFKPNNVKSYGLKKENFISVSLESLVTPISKNRTKTTSMKSVSQETDKNVDVNNLFSDVWTKKITNKIKNPKPVESRRILEIQKKLKTTKNNKIDSMSQKINNIENIQMNDDAKAISSAEEVNEYLAKIQAIVYLHFNVPANTEGNSVKSVIELNALGKVVDFRILTYSSSEALNTEADKIKDRLLNVIFPVNPENKSTRTIVVLISKE